MRHLALGHAQRGTRHAPRDIRTRPGAMRHSAFGHAPRPMRHAMRHAMRRLLPFWLKASPCVLNNLDFKDILHGQSFIQTHRLARDVARLNLEVRSHLGEKVYGRHS